MTDSNIIKKLKKHKKNSNKKRQIFLNSFAEKNDLSHDQRRKSRNFPSNG